MLVIIFWKIKTLDKNSYLKHGFFQRPAAALRMAGRTTAKTERQFVWTRENINRKLHPL